MKNIGRPAAYLSTEHAGHVIKGRLVQPFATSKSLSFPSQKQAVGSFLTSSQLILL